MVCFSKVYIDSLRDLVPYVGVENLDKTTMMRIRTVVQPFLDFIIQQLKKSQVECVVLEADGSEIDDNEVLLKLPANTSLQVLAKGQAWKPSKS